MQPQAAHSVPIFLSVAVVHGQPWTNNHNNRNNSYNSLLVHHTCHMDAPLADECLEWRWLRNVNPKYLYRRSLYHWLRQCRQVDPSGLITYPWQGSALTAT